MDRVIRAAIKRLNGSSEITRKWGLIQWWNGSIKIGETVDGGNLNVYMLAGGGDVMFRGDDAKLIVEKCG
jgi:hypothetical protein